MKMGHALFWGLLLILIGLNIILRIVFNLNFPLLKIIIAFAFIYIGLKILLGGSGIFTSSKNKNDVFFKEQKYSVLSDNNDYNVVFGKGIFDFRNITVSEAKRNIKISTIFGASLIKLNNSIPVRIKVDAAFAGVKLPNGNSAVFGNTYFESPGLDIREPYLDIKVEAVFSAVEVKFD